MKKKPVKNKEKKKFRLKGKDVTTRLYNAVIAYIESKGGTSVVIGGIALVDEGRKYNYGVMVRVTGVKPIIKPL